MGSFRVGILALVLVVAACSSTEQGTPVAQQGIGGTTNKTQTSAPASASAKPARPRTIDLKQFDPCKIVENVAPELGFRPEKRAAEAAQGYQPGSVLCIQSRTQITLGPGMLLLLAMNRSLEEHATSYLVTTPVTLEGFPALVMEGNYRNDCYVGVDVADDQTLSVQWTINLESGNPPRSEVCEGARKAAAAVMKVVAAA